MKDNFIHVKNMWKEQLCKLKVGDFCYGFLGPKTFRDLRETGPCSSKIDISEPWGLDARQKTNSHLRLTHDKLT